MKFGPVPTRTAAGTILAHSIEVAGLRLRKGAWLGDDDIATLLNAGLETITVAALAPDDLHEDAAAQRLAAAIVPDPDAAHVTLSRAATGRVNITATGPGIVMLDRAGLEAVNAVDPMITIATLPSFQRVEAGTMVGTVKIIAYGVPQAHVGTAAAAGAAALRVQPPILQTATLIETQIGAKIPATKGRDALQTRLRRLGAALTEAVTVPHRIDAIAQAIGGASGDIIFLLTGSATSDCADTAPEAVRAAGGRMVHFGMPVDPGNLLFLGDYHGRPVIGLPGCARSPALNGADWVLERVLCGVTVSPTDIAAMGVGGLLKESPRRGMPRRMADRRR